MKRVLVLYSELAAYFIACLRELVSSGEIEAHVVRWPVHKDAPFDFVNEPGIFYYDRKDMDIKAMIALGESISPVGVYVTGWIDKDYLTVGKHFRKKKIPVIAAFDTHWKGTFRQWIAVSVSPFYIKKVFTHMWVPGLFQYEYARRLGYSRELIYTGMYAADTKLFQSGHEAAIARKSEKYPKRLLFVGRLVDFKGIDELTAAFGELIQEGHADWTLTFVGNGPMKDALTALPNVEVRSFVQPDELRQIAWESGVFVLPSRYEAWGVVVHEFAAAGLPLILGSEVGAATSLLRPGYNGFRHQSGDVQSLKCALKRMMLLSPEELLEMGRRSNVLSQQISPKTWTSTFREILQLNSPCAE